MRTLRWAQARLQCYIRLVKISRTHTHIPPLIAVGQRQSHLGHTWVGSKEPGTHLLLARSCGSPRSCAATTGRDSIGLLPVLECGPTRGVRPSMGRDAELLHGSSKRKVEVPISLGRDILRFLPRPDRWVIVSRTYARAGEGEAFIVRQQVSAVALGTCRTAGSDPKQCQHAIASRLQVWAPG